MSNPPPGNVRRHLQFEVLLNVDEGGRGESPFVVGYRPGHALHRAFAGTLYVEVAATASSREAELTACEKLFHIFNAPPDLLTEEEQRLERLYRAQRNRSLSVGDVVRLRGLGGKWNAYSCDRVGFSQVHDPLAK
jgi:hypothetical protein